MKFVLNLTLKQRQVLPCEVLPVFITHGEHVQEMLAFTAADLYSQLYSRMRIKHSNKGMISYFSLRTCNVPFLITFRGRLIPNRPIGLREYGVIAGNTLNVSIGGLNGGFKPLYPDQIQKSRKCEPVEDYKHLESSDLQRYQKVANKLSKRKEYNEMNIQSVPLDLFNTFKKAIDTIKISTESHYAHIIEDVLLCALQLYKAKDSIDVSLAIMSFVKLRSGKSISSVYAQLCSSLISTTFNVESLFEDADICTFPMQSSTPTENLLDSFREFMNNWDDAKDSELGRKYTNLFKNLMTLGMLEWIGIKPTKRIIYGVREVNGTWLDYANLVHCIIDTASLTLLRAIQASRTGSFDSFIHGPKSYQQWYDLCM